MSRPAKVAAGLFVIAAVLTVAAVWWWALVGMSEDVGAAAVLTICTVALAGVAMVLVDIGR